MEKNYFDLAPAELAKRNVSDYYKAWAHDAILADLDTKRNPFINVCMNLTGDFSKSSIVRNANAWLAKETWMVGRRRFDVRGAVGTHHYEKVKHSETWEEVRDYLRSEGYTLYAIDNIPEYSPKIFYNSNIAEKAAFIFGEEQAGLSEDVIKDCDEMLYIPQFGSVRSVNVAVAAGVIMNEWVRQHKPIIDISS